MDPLRDPLRSGALFRVKDLSTLRFSHRSFTGAAAVATTGAAAGTAGSRVSAEHLHHMRERLDQLYRATPAYAFGPYAASPQPLPTVPAAPSSVRQAASPVLQTPLSADVIPPAPTPTAATSSPVSRAMGEPSAAPQTCTPHGDSDTPTARASPALELRSPAPPSAEAKELTPPSESGLRGTEGPPAARVGAVDAHAALAATERATVEAARESSAVRASAPTSARVRATADTLSTLASLQPSSSSSRLSTSAPIRAASAPRSSPVKSTTAPSKKRKDRQEPLPREAPQKTRGRGRSDERASGAEWTRAEDAALREAHTRVNPMREDFWEQVSTSVSGRSVDECSERWFKTLQRKPTKASGTDRTSKPKRAVRSEVQKLLDSSRIDDATTDGDASTVAHPRQHIAVLSIDSPRDSLVGMGGESVVVVEPNAKWKAAYSRNLRKIVQKAGRSAATRPFDPAKELAGIARSAKKGRVGSASQGRSPSQSRVKEGTLTGLMSKGGRVVIRNSEADVSDEEVEGSDDSGEGSGDYISD